MGKMKNYIAEHRGIVISAAVILAVLIVGGVWLAITLTGPGEATEEDAYQQVSLEELQPLIENDILTGLEQIETETGKTLDLEGRVSGDGSIVTGIRADDSDVDYEIAGTYEVVYFVSFDSDQLDAFLKENDLTVSFAGAQGVTVKVPVTVTGQKSDSEQEGSNASASDGVTSDQNTSSQPDSGTSSSGQAESSGSTASAGSAGGGESSGHQHVWVDHTTKVWVSNIVTVVDQPEQVTEYSLYRMYWYNTGTWEETRDAARFDEWYHSEWGSLYPLMHPFARPEDNPLFQKYNEYGQAVYTGDHSIIHPLYDVVPAVTHEEDQGYYEDQVDYQYCSVCGARR